jgi:hypothetical protein
MFGEFAGIFEAGVVPGSAHEIRERRGWYPPAPRAIGVCSDDYIAG